MISILIPIYNFNIVSLVTELQKQATQAQIPFEIIVMDDCSSELLRDQNKGVAKLAGVKFLELDKNIGRASIRNRLAELAGYTTLLFMDCDSEVAEKDFIKNYIPYCGRDVVVCGGRVYRRDPPEEPDQLLRWLYGVYREQIPVRVRNSSPYRSFMTNNFLISRSILSQIPFDESIVQYGHEDTLFGFELRRKGIPVIHIQNPLIHIGLEIAREFIRKSSEGIENLITLVRVGKINRTDFKDIRLLQAFDLLYRLRAVRLYMQVYNQVERIVMDNLMGANPSMKAFDLYKLSHLAKLICKNKTTIPFYNRL
jgi:GT2 family glycosyltransferase